MIEPGDACQARNSADFGGIARSEKTLCWRRAPKSTEAMDYIVAVRTAQPALVSLTHRNCGAMSAGRNYPTISNQIAYFLAGCLSNF